MISDANTTAYLRFADTYDALAEQQEQLVRDIAELKINVREKRSSDRLGAVGCGAAASWALTVEQAIQQKFDLSQPADGLVA